MGDFHSRHTLWDSSVPKSTPMGNALHSFATKMRFKVLAPDSPTCLSSRKGSSTVDLFLTRNISLMSHRLELPSGWPQISDHRPVAVSVCFSTPVTFNRRVPLSVLRNPLFRERAHKFYQHALPTCITHIENSQISSELEVAASRLAATFLKPFAANTCPRPARFRSGWSKSIDQLRARVTKLLKSPETKHEGQALD